MDWKIFISSFGLIFLAELGDKTQFAAVGLAAGSENRISVLLGVIAALALAGALGVLAGSILGQFINPATMKWLSGSLFVAVGLWILVT